LNGGKTWSWFLNACFFTVYPESWENDPDMKVVTITLDIILTTLGSCYESLLISGMII